MLYLIGLGLSKKDISFKGLKIVKKAHKVYLENYTSKLDCTTKDLENFFGKEITEVDREFVEKNIQEVFKESKENNIAFLVMGDVFSATTHIDLFLRAKKENISIQIIHGNSILTAIGITGLSIYNFGKTISIPFNNQEVTSPYENFLTNKKNEMHTLFLLDLNPKENKFMTIKEGLEYLIKNGLSNEELVIGCARIGTENQIIKAGKIKDIINFNFGQPPYCFIIPGKLHFIEEEALELWK